MRRKLWNVKEIDFKAKEFGEKFNVSFVLAQVLFNRGIDGKSLEKFLYPDFCHLHDPNLLPDMGKAVERIHKAVKNKENILIVGDYDVDGIVSLAVFYEFIKEFPGTFSFYIPHRSQEGYGLSKKAIDIAKDKGAGLIIAFDCGTNSFEEVALARSLGMDVIVVDHHHPKDNFDTPLAFINPKRKDSTYPFVDLSGGALSFKLLQALRDCPSNDVLDLVALSLVCDVVPLLGENRVLLKEGLKVIRNTNRPGIKALCKAGSIKQENIDVFHIGYILGPRLNASGRVAHARDSLEIFLSEDCQEIDSMVSKLSEYNKLRKEIESKILKEAEESVAKDFTSDYAIVVANDGWHPGVLGIVASRLADKYYRPSFVISFEDDIGRGSARSIHSVNLIEALGKCSNSLLLYGGHSKAAGIQISKQDLELFREQINNHIKNNLAPHDLIPVIDVDVQLNFKDITMSLIEELQLLKPFGEGNSQPLFASFNISKKNPPQKINSGHSVWLSNGTMTLEGIIYDKGILEIINFADKFDIVYSLEKNNYYNTVRLVIRDCKLARGNS